MKQQNRIKALRKSKGVSQKGLSEAIGIGQTAISQWETGKTFPDMETSIKLAQYFNVSIDYIFGLVDIPAPLDQRETQEIHTPNTKRPDVYDGLTPESQRDLDKYILLLKIRDKTSEIACLTDGTSTSNA